MQIDKDLSQTQSNVKLNVNKKNVGPMHTLRPIKRLTNCHYYCGQPILQRSLMQRLHGRTVSDGLFVVVSGVCICVCPWVRADTTTDATTDSQTVPRTIRWTVRHSIRLSMGVATGPEKTYCRKSTVRRTVQEFCLHEEMSGVVSKK